MIKDETVSKALAAFNECINNPQMISCTRCNGKGFHHGFGEYGASPDWCVECGGNAFNIVPGEEERAMRAALEAALAAVHSEVSNQLEISRELLGEIVDEVFDGAIEDASVIEDIYRVIKREEAAIRALMEDPK